MTRLTWASAARRLFPLMALCLLGACAHAPRGGSGEAGPVAAPLLPPEGKVLFFMGQDTESLVAYKEEALDRDPSLPRPGGITLYTNISEGRGSGVLDGIYAATNYGSGTVAFAPTLARFPGASLALGLDLNDNQNGCRNIHLRAIGGLADGDTVTTADVQRYRGYVDSLLTYLKELDRPVFLRIGYEFDGPWNCYRPEPYKAAFRYIASRITSAGATNVATVWQTAAYPRNQGAYTSTDPDLLGRYYPGDDAVDWVALSRFFGKTSADEQWSCSALSPEWFSPHIDPTVLHERLLDFARAHGKPVMIAEAAPQGFQVDVSTASCIFSHRDRPIGAERLWNLWYRDFFDFIQDNRDVIRAAAYINADWDNQPMWHCDDDALAGSAACPQGYWGDSRVQANPEILRRWRAELQKPLFVQPE